MSNTAYFGIMLPNGWTIVDSILCTNITTNDTGFIVHSESLSQQMSLIDLPQENYYWWVGMISSIWGQLGATFISDLKIYTDNQTGSFFLDYMLGDPSSGLNYKRSNDHLIIVGDPVGCLPEGIVFTTQEEIDNFTANYPSCTETAGSVKISGDDITNLDGLSVLISIGGNLKIEFNDTLTSLTGLDNLVYIGGTLSINGNNSLTSLSGLNNLTAIGRDLWIESNNNLINLIGLEGLTDVGDDLAVISNPELVNLTGFDFVTSIAGNLLIEYNDSLTSLASLSNISYLGGSIGINSCGALTNLSGLEGLTSIAGNLSIYGNDFLTSLSGLENLSYIGGSLGVGTNLVWSGVGNPSLTNIESLSNLTSIGGGIDIISNENLLSLSGLNNINSIEGNIKISENNSLTDLTGFNSLTSIGGDLRINSNEALGNINDLDNLNSIGGNLSISGNDALVSLTGLNALVSIGENMGISGDALASLTSLSNLSYLGGRIGINSCGALINLSGLEGLSSIGGNLLIGGNLALNSLTGLEGIISIGGNLIIEDNPTLTDIWGLVNIDSVSIEDLHIVNNPLLSECDIQNICKYLASPNGTVNIQNNATGCNSPEEVEDNCNHHCLPEGISFTTQAEIDSFQINYPDCDNIEGELWIHGNDISNLNGLSVLTSIGGDLYIDDNEVMANLTGLEGITSIGGNLIIEDNPTLTDIWGLVNIDPVSIEDLHIVNNPLLFECDIQNICEYLASPNGTVNIQNNASGCNSPVEVEDICSYHCLPDGISFTSQAEIDSFQINYPDCDDIVGELWIHGNDISNLNGLSVLTSIGGDLYIDDNEVMANLTGLEGLTYIGGDLIIGSYPGGNPALASLTGLSGLTFIGGKLHIYVNPSLASLSGLENVNYHSIEDLVIIHNSLLSTCHVESICNYLADPSGTIEIHDNVPGCNNPEEVDSLCNIVSVNEFTFRDEYSISPNPLNSTTLIQYTLHQNTPVTLKILDLSGREMTMLVNKVQQPGEQQVVFITNGLPAGIYFCVLKTNYGMQTKKIIKLIIVWS